MKIPKAPIFHKVIIEDTVPSPHVFLEETGYYSLVWQSPLFKYGNTSMTYIDLSYKTVLDGDSVVYWAALALTSSIISISFLLGVGNWIKRKLLHIQKSEFEIFEDKAGKFRFRMKAANGEIIAMSEAYESKQACLNGIKLIKKTSPNAKIQDAT